MADVEWWDRYEGVRLRITAVVVDDDRALRAPLTACPAWSGRELLSHLVGIAQDVEAGRIDGWGSDAWTSEQVARGSTQTVGALLESWPGAAQAVRDADIGGVPASLLAFGDAVVHEADLLATPGVGRRVPDDDVALAVKTGIARWRQALGAAGARPVRIAVPGHREWWLGDRTQGPVLTLEANQYELFRVLFGRRSLDQVRALSWSQDPTTFLEALPYPFRWAERDVDE